MCWSDTRRMLVEYISIRLIENKPHATFDFHSRNLCSSLWKKWLILNCWGHLMNILKFNRHWSAWALIDLLKLVYIKYSFQNDWITIVFSGISGLHTWNTRILLRRQSSRWQHSKWVLTVVVWCSVHLQYLHSGSPAKQTVLRSNLLFRVSVACTTT